VSNPDTHLWLDLGQAYTWEEEGVVVETLCTHDLDSQYKSECIEGDSDEVVHIWIGRSMWRKLWIISYVPVDIRLQAIKYYTITNGTASKQMRPPTYYNN
jgi:hypothetical protein